MEMKLYGDEEWEGEEMKSQMKRWRGVWKCIKPNLYRTKSGKNEYIQSVLTTKGSKSKTGLWMV